MGYDWDGVDDLPQLIRSQANGLVLQIFSAAGRRDLDSIVRATVERTGKLASSLSLVERYLREEARFRQVRSEDLDAIRRLLDELTETLR